MTIDEIRDLTIPELIHYLKAKYAADHETRLILDEIFNDYEAKLFDARD